VGVDDEMLTALDGEKPRVTGAAVTCTRFVNRSLPTRCEGHIFLEARHSIMPHDFQTESGLLRFGSGKRGQLVCSDFRPRKVAESLKMEARRRFCLGARSNLIMIHVRFQAQRSAEKTRYQSIARTRENPGRLLPGFSSYRIVDP